MSILKFTPIYMERVWGGSRLADVYGRRLPEGKRIGESWEVVDREEAQSVVAEGPWAGQSLAELMRTNAKDLMGADWPSGLPFPILVKWLDCAKRLSLQVHPPERVAAELGGEPKTENWYVAEAAPGAGLIAGLKRGVTSAAFRDALRDKTAEALCHRFPSRPGDSLLVESGRIHAIDAGNLILEVQQNSDTTYRTYDWGRLGLDGKPRQLHLEESLKCIDFTDYEPAPLTSSPDAKEQVLADCDSFRLRKFVWEAGEEEDLAPAGAASALIHVVKGGLSREGGELLPGETGLVPWASSGLVRASGRTTFLLTDCFAVT